ncbi:hypothetical protein HNR46_001923 [Haloferula luteola]|uniref:Uncharacterized protein n=1 Tax=Haloferula luteola TaxID=595692 RepID=A0A840V7W9_9BACT|nr:hypothetical protein [Haloferula luteola]MBB5351684.1 hypothetical protein [Haloferula luteola]
MKVNVWVLVGVTILVVAIEEARMEGLKKHLAEHSQVSSPVASSHSSSLPPGTPSDEEAPPKSALRDPKTPDDDRPPVDLARSDMGKTLRKMSENEIGRSMMAQGVKAMAAQWYADLIKDFGLNADEADYFLNLKAQSAAEQQQIGMKLMGANEEERQALMEEIEQSQKDNEEAIQSFLNDDQDFASYQHYEKRLAEHQQLDTLRQSMAGTQSPLRPEQEDALVEAMYEARTQHQSVDWNGTEGFAALEAADARERFEKDWDTQNAAVLQQASEVLDDPQMKTFRTYREQMKEMQLMGIEMAQKMFQRTED